MIVEPVDARGRKRRAHADYERNRLRAIKAGTWNPRRTQDPTVDPELTELGWAAGFLDGEGHFRSAGDGLQSQVVNACQKDREPLERLLAYFGGSITEFTHTSNRNTYLRWNACGWKARRCMDLVYPHVSKRRQAQIEGAMNWNS